MLINSYFKEFLEEKIGFREIKWNEMIVFGNLIYYYLLCVNLYSPSHFSEQIKVFLEAKIGEIGLYFASVF